MSLRDQMAVDACAILNTDELGERATWAKSTGSSLPRTVRVIEQPDRQTIRRAHIWTAAEGTAVSAGDLFTVKRGAVSTVWRVLYSDPAETAMQRHYCHQQLTEFITLRRRRHYTTQAKAKQSAITTEAGSIRAKWFTSAADIQVKEDGKRRGMETEFYCLIESLLDISAVDTVVDADGKAFRIERLENQFSRIDLPYLICRRSDT
jgi:hypothetical protein